MLEKVAKNQETYHIVVLNFMFVNLLHIDYCIDHTLHSMMSH